MALATVRNAPGVVDADWQPEEEELGTARRLPYHRSVGCHDTQGNATQGNAPQGNATQRNAT